LFTLPLLYDCSYTENRLKPLLQLRVFRFRSDENRNVRVGVLPGREEILIRGSSFGRLAFRRYFKAFTTSLQFSLRKLFDVMHDEVRQART